MTLSPWIIYLWGIADSIGSALGLTAFVSIVAMFMTLVFGCMARDNGHKEGGEQLHRWTLRCAIFAAICVSVNTLIPSSKTIAIMVVVPAIVNSEPIQKDMPELYKLGVEALKEQLKEAVKP